LVLKVGLFFSFFAVVLIFLYVVNYFIADTIPSGWSALVVLLLLFNAINLIVLGIIGSYIGGIYQEVKSRPRYIIDEVIKNEK